MSTNNSLHVLSTFIVHLFKTNRALHLLELFCILSYFQNVTYIKLVLVRLGVLVDGNEVKTRTEQPDNSAEICQIKETFEGVFDRLVSSQF